MVKVDIVLKRTACMVEHQREGYLRIAWLFNWNGLVDFSTKKTCMYGAKYTCDGSHTRKCNVIRWHDHFPRTRWGFALAKGANSSAAVITLNHGNYSTTQRYTPQVSPTYIETRDSICH